MYLRPISVSLFAASDSVVMGHTGNRDFLGEDGIHAAGKTDLDGSPHLTTVEGAFDKGGHHRPKGADIIEIPAHKIPDFPVQKGIVFFGRFQIFIHSQIGQRLCVAALQGDLVFDIDAVTFTVLLNGFPHK